MGALKALGNHRPNSHSLALNQKKSISMQGGQVLQLEGPLDVTDIVPQEESKDQLHNTKAQISASPPSIVAQNTQQRQ